MHNPQEIADLIEHIAKEQGLTINKLLIKSGLDKNVISRMKSRNQALSAEKLTKIADTLNVSLDYLLGRSNKINIERKEAARQYMQDELHRIGTLPEDEEITPEKFDLFLEYFAFFRKQTSDALDEDK